MSIENKSIALKLKETWEMSSHNTAHMLEGGEIIFEKMFSQEFDRYPYGDDRGIIYPYRWPFLCQPWDLEFLLTNWLTYAPPPPARVLRPLVSFYNPNTGVYFGRKLWLLTLNKCDSDSH